MKKLLGFATVAVVLGIAGATDAGAVCGAPLIFGQATPNCGGGYCYVVSPASTAGATGGSFWALGFGNPAVDSPTAGGDDSDGFPVQDWCRPSGPGCYLVGDWGGDERVDGCIGGKVAAGKTAEIMVVGLSDGNAGQGFFAVAAVGRQPTGSDFDYANIGQNLTLAPIPTPNITNTVRTAPNVAITVNSPAITAGFFGDASVTQGDLVKSYRIYKQVLARGAAAPSTRNRSAWTAAGAAVAVGQPFSYTETSCATNSDIWLATAVVFDSGFETSFVSGNSRPVQCGPTIAEPSDKGFKVIERKGGSTRTPSSN